MMLLGERRFCDARLALLGLALGLTIGTIACGSADRGDANAVHVVVAERDDDDGDDASEGGSLTRSDLGAPDRDPIAILTALEMRAEGSYLHELLDSRDGWNYRWPDRRLEAMRVWIQPSALAGYREPYARAVEQAFHAWAEIGLPFIFTIVRDSARAEVHVTWVDRFDGRMTGRTNWRHDRHGWILGGSIEMALHLPDGRAVTLDGVRAVALHEVGHLLGLDHPNDSTSVMSAQVFVTQMSEADRRTARLVYDLPPGRIRP
jgi:hypothetical protein